ncbi:MAG: acyl-CoA desaturase [Kiritimatiellae bacterium]|nr:acyl-CoA desaturase [Kiritimatiellia bacterium]NKB24456.1 acyl-CoA desaturase [Kiritimatiellia bacterium]
MNPLKKIYNIYRKIFSEEENITLIDGCPIAFVHLVCLTIPWVGFSVTAVIACFAAYALRVFSLTGGYHRYFSHRSYKTSRVFQFILAFLGGSAAQLGALWWAAHHRHHHEHSDTKKDIHSPHRRGFFFAHIGWVLCDRYSETQLEHIGDFARYPELRFLNRFHIIPPLTLGLIMYGLGYFFQTHYPHLNTSPWQMVVWGFFVSTVLVYHATFCINSVTHMMGKKRFRIKDDSRNSFLLAFLTMGEGWHNNHHRYPMATRQGLYWWEIDMTYYILVLLSKLGLIWDLQKHPQMIYEEARQIKQDI